MRVAGLLDGRRPLGGVAPAILQLEVGDKGLADLDTAFSDYIYNRLTVIVTSDVSRSVAINLFVNWQPENHRVNRHDTDTRIVSGGVEYRF